MNSLEKDLKALEGALYGKNEKHRLNSNQVILLKEKFVNNKCEYCKKKLDTYLLDHHHIKPLKDDGKNNPANIIILCCMCHRRAHHKEISRGRLREIVSKRNKKLAKKGMKYPGTKKRNSSTKKRSIGRSSDDMINDMRDFDSKLGRL